MHRPARPATAPPRARARAVGAFACVALGISLARWHVHLPAPVWFAIAAGAGAAAFLTSGWACRVALVVGAIAISGCYLTARVHEPARDALSRLVPPDAWLTSPAVRVEGTLTADPVITRSVRTNLDLPFDDQPSSYARLDVARVETPAGWQRARGSLTVFVREGGIPWRAGDGVRLAGTFEPMKPASNPGEPDRGAHARAVGLAGTLNVPDGSLIEPAPIVGVRARMSAGWSGFRARVRARAQRAMGITPGDPGDALIGAIVLGQRDPTLDPHTQAFARVGVGHLLAISGFHLAVLAGLALVLVRASGERGWVEPALVMLVVLLYVFVLPARTPILRAALMVLLLLGAETAGRRYDRLTVLAWAGIALLVWRPLDLFNAGYQLSMSVTAVLLAMGEHQKVARRADIRAALPTPPRLPRWIRGPANWTAAYGRTCIACWLVATPIVMAHLHVLSPLGPIATMLTMPLVLVSLQLGYLAALVGLVTGPVGWLGGGAGWMGDITVAFVTWVDAFALTSVRTGPVSALWAFVAASVAFWIASRARWRDPLAWAAVLLLGTWAVIEMRTAEHPSPAVALRVDTLDVGDGTCHLVRSAEATMLWDAGSLAPGIADRTLEPALRALGVRSIDAAVITHANLDHFNALPHLAEVFGIETVLTTDVLVRAAEERPWSPEGRTLARLRTLGVTIETLRAGDTRDLGHARVDIVWPPEDLPTRGVTAANDTSLVAQFVVSTTTGDRRALMTGDIQAAGIRGVLDALGDDARVAVLELPHHGSVSPEAAALVQALDPAVVLQSTGVQRAREPAWSGVRAGRAWWVTAEHGAAHAEILLDGSITSGAMIDRR